ncbi:MAG: hypothetical protein D6772_10025, partial [Bacteroidetes bacterium]
MIIIRLKGGLGNQMFEYAFAKGVTRRLQTEFRVDLSLLLDRSRKEIVFRDYDLDVFQVEPDFIASPAFLKQVYRIKSSKLSKWVRRWMIRGFTEYQEPHFHVVPDLLDNPPDQVAYNGWWQSPKYFA